MNRGKLIASVGAAVAALLLTAVPTFEGTVHSTYRDPVGVLTSCTGHTGPELKMGQVFTPAQCAAQLEADLAAHAAVQGGCIKVPLSDGEKAAYTDLQFNIGVPRFCGSTLVRKLNAGDRAGACAELSKWVYANGAKLPGLVRRRAEGRKWCEQ